MNFDFTGGKFIIENGSETAYYVKNDGFCAYGSLHDLKISDTCESLDLTNPIVDATKFIVNNISNSIKVILDEGVAIDDESGIDKYVINLYEGDKLVKTQEKKKIGETIFTDVKSLCVYTVELIVFNGAGGDGGGTSGGSGNSSPGYSTSCSAFGYATDSSVTWAECGGGGGGWYGGYVGTQENNSGGAGSGYVYTSSTSSYYPSGFQLYSSYYLTSASTTSGYNSGQGYARVTLLSLDS